MYLSDLTLNFDYFEKLWMDISLYKCVWLSYSLSENKKKKMILKVIKKLLSNNLWFGWFF